MTDPLEVELSLSFGDAIRAVTECLRQEGFGVLTRIDLDRAFEEKLGETFRPYCILGACNPHLAFRAVSARPEVGLYLPCNVTVEEMGDSAAHVRFLDPMQIMGQASFADDPDMIAVAEEARARIGRVVDNLA